MIVFLLNGLGESCWVDSKDGKYPVDCIITKDSGAAGGYQAKADAAAALGIPLLVVQRPPMSYPLVASTFDAGTWTRTSTPMRPITWS